MAKEYIEREAAIQQLELKKIEREKRGAILAADEDEIIRWLNTLSAADVAPVVRCRDCKYRRDDDFCGGRGWPEQLVPDDGYCDRGREKGR